MNKSHILLSILILSSLLTACAGSAVAQSNDFAPSNTSVKAEPTAIPEVVLKSSRESCPVTVPQESAFTPPAPYDELGFKGYYWFGSEGLWTSLPQDGAWHGLPEDPGGFTQKVFWWREGYIWNEEPEPHLIVTGERLDAKALPLKASKATNAFAEDIGSAMLVGVEIPTVGCWKITGQYGKAELSFVVWVGS